MPCVHSTAKYANAASGGFQTVLRALGKHNQNIKRFIRFYLLYYLLSRLWQSRQAKKHRKTSTASNSQKVEVSPCDKKDGGNSE